MNTFKNDQYTITTSLNERSAIYIKIANNISYMCYEGNFDSAAFKLPFELDAIYELVNKCFAEKSDREEEDAPSSRSIRSGESYRVTTKLDNGILQLLFHCVLGGFLTVKFDLRLREKLMSNDTQLSINFQRVEQNQTKALERIDTVASQMVEFAKKMKEMERRLEALGHADICFLKPPSNRVENLYSFPIHSKKLDVNANVSIQNGISQESFEKIKHFYQLEELILSNCKWYSPNTVISNATVKKLSINGSEPFSDISFIKNFPELEELEMRGFAVDGSIVTTLRSIKHKIRKLTFQSISGINQTEMQTYCTQNNIVLNLS